MKKFEDFWGNKGEKYNGKIDIKNFAEEVWDSRNFTIDEIRKVYEKSTGVSWDFNQNDFYIWVECCKALGIFKG